MTLHLQDDWSQDNPEEQILHRFGFSSTKKLHVCVVNRLATINDHLAHIDLTTINVDLRLLKVVSSTWNDDLL